MKSLTLIVAILGIALSVQSAESKSFFTKLSLETYSTVAFENFDGEDEAGVGIAALFDLSPTVQLVGFGESDNEKHSTFDRAGVGVQLTGRLGKSLRPFARMSVGYAFDPSSGIASDTCFLRPQFGAQLQLWKGESVSLSLVGSWALDVSFEGKASQRLSAGLNFGF